MKGYKQTVRHYYKKVEYTTAGTYTFTVSSNTTCKVVLVGAGAGGALAASGVVGTVYAYGGCGALIQGTISLNVGTYTVVVGAASSNVGGSDGGYTAQNGGDTSFNSNVAGGGKGGYAYAFWNGSVTNGAGGTPTITTSGLAGASGNSGTTNNTYGNYGGGGYSGTNAKSGYASFIYESTSSDYDYYEDVNTYSLYKSGTTYKAFNV